jgi:hypothetical protein
MIAVLQAAKSGKIIQCRPINSECSWVTLTNPVYNFSICDYRVKPEPRVIYVEEHIGFRDIDRTKVFFNNGDFPIPRPNIRMVKFVEVID